MLSVCFFWAYTLICFNFLYKATSLHGHNITRVLSQQQKLLMVQYPLFFTQILSLTHLIFVYSFKLCKFHFSNSLILSPGNLCYHPHHCLRCDNVCSPPSLFAHRFHNQVTISNVRTGLRIIVVFIILLFFYYYFVYIDVMQQQKSQEQDIHISDGPS